MNAVRPLLHELVDGDDNDAVRRLAIVCAPERLAAARHDRDPRRAGEDDESRRELREAAAKVAAFLKKKADPSR